MNQEIIEKHDNQIDEIWAEMENRQKEMEKQINANQTLDENEKK